MNCKPNFLKRPYTVFFQLCIFFCLLFQSKAVFGQYPNYFLYNDEKGLPSNEIYSIIQDNKGFIWIGGDAGLFRFNGIRYQSFKSLKQKSRSLTGLTISVSGKLYCYNFIGQIFVQEGDSLNFLNREFQTISNISTDKIGNIYVSYAEGVSVYNEQIKRWKDILKYKNNRHLGAFDFGAKCIATKAESGLYYIDKYGVNVKIGNSSKIVKTTTFKQNFPGGFLLEKFKNELLIFSIDKGLFFRFANNRLQKISNPNLLKVLQGRKLTRVKFMKDNKLWICTYTGIIDYDFKTDKADVFYPEMSFSDCMIDSEGNYWFSTLQSGLLRVTNLKQLVWNKEFAIEDNDRISKLTFDGKNIFFSNVIGTVGKLNTKNFKIHFFQTPYQADIQSLDVDSKEKKVIFSINNLLFEIKENKLTQTQIVFPATKTFCRAENDIFLGSSSILGQIIGGKATELKRAWVRAILYDRKFHNLWVACNDGLYLFKKIDSKWVLKRTFLKDNQILSISLDKKSGRIYGLSFEGVIYKVTTKNASILTQLQTNLQVKKLTFNRHNIYVATTKGVYSYDLKYKKGRFYNKYDGIASNSINDVYVVDEYLWLATGKGLQQFPIHSSPRKPKAKVFISKVNVGKENITNYQKIVMNYEQSLEIYPEVVSFSSNGNFKLAYKMNDGEWNKFPGSIGVIYIPNFPSGNFKIEVAAFDYLGRKSENSVFFSGRVYPPIWERTWFYVLSAVLFVLLVLGISRYIIHNIRKKALLETELSNLKLTAIKAQMNPHFIFNSLNSIQDLILKGDVENSYSYIITFSNLVRKTLEYSGKNLVDFEQEVELLKLYLALENLRFKNELQTELIVPEIENVSIPPMLIQPFIENALIHGLLHKEGVKKLKIEFQLNDQLICIIEDNGVGREQSKIIKNRRGVNHASFSGDAIQKRFEILNKSFEFKYGFKYEDLTENNQVTGTRVTIIIPFKPLF